MTFLTVFTAPKPFTDAHISMIQRNAIQSWIQLRPQVEVFLMGNEEGMADVARDYKIQYFPEVWCSDQGTPKINSMIETALQNSDAPYLGILNADIILMPDFVEAIRQVSLQTKKFLLLGRRWDLDADRTLEFDPDWEIKLRGEVEERGILHGPFGCDYFVFPRDLLVDMPDFTIGRSGWDNWTIYHAVKSGWKVIDATRSAMVVHQNHDYRHLPGGKPPYDLPETKENIAKAGGLKTMYSILEANTMLVNGELIAAPISVPRLLHRIELLITRDDLYGWRRSFVRRLKRARRRYEHQL